MVKYMHVNCNSDPHFNIVHKNCSQEPYIYELLYHQHAKSHHNYPGFEAAKFVLVDFSLK